MRSLSLAEIAELCDPGFNPLPILLRPAQILSNDWGPPQKEEIAARVPCLEVIVASGDRLRIANGVDATTLRLVLDILRR
jgi:hypothetical protein